MLVGASALGFGARAGIADAATEPPAIQRTVTLGKTGLRISDIGFGSTGCKSADLVRHCFDRGINYFDTAGTYRSEGRMRGEFVENLIGEALQGKRDKVVLTTKCQALRHNGRKKIMQHLEGSLRRLRTDYVDIFLNHAVNDVRRLQNPEWLEFVELAKKQGKIRFSGMSGHGGRLIECLDYALDHEMADVILCAYNFGSDPAFYEQFTKAFDLIANQAGIQRVFEKAHAQGVGVIAMKTQMGAKLNDLSRFQQDGADFRRAAIRWVFSDPHVDSLVVSMKNRELADRYIAASGEVALRTTDAALLRHYVAENNGDYCRNACSECEESCPRSVPIADVLRQRMYALRYDSPRTAREGYAALGDAAAACLTCTAEPCGSACAYGLEIPKLTRETARLLS
jgi:predicted aldo/keto reductase-like oxidoreductase